MNKLVKRLVLATIIAIFTFSIIWNYIGFSKEERFIVRFITKMFTNEPINESYDLRAYTIERFKNYLSEDAAEQSSIIVAVGTYFNLAIRHDIASYEVSNFEFDEQGSLYYWVKFQVEVNLDNGEKETYHMSSNIRLVFDDKKYQVSFIRTYSDREFSKKYR